MPSCPYGAEPIPIAKGIQAWVDQNTIRIEALEMVLPKFWDKGVAIAKMLIDYDNLCSLNLDPPESFEPFEILLLSSTPAAQSHPSYLAAIEKVYAWIRYYQFLSNCVCLPPPIIPGHNCTNAPSSFPLGPLNSVSAEFPVTLDQAVIDSWLTHPNGDWRMGFSGRAVVDGGAHDGHALTIEYFSSSGTWVNTSIWLMNLMQQPGYQEFEFQASVPKPGVASSIRIRNQAGGSHTIANFEWCFEATPAQPKPPNVQEPLDSIPDSPAIVCDDNTLCTLITVMMARVDRLASQISDIQASVTTRDTLAVIASQEISGEGEATLVLGTRAVSVELTALSDEAFTSALGRPRGLMRVGSIRYGDGVGYSPRRFIDADRFDDVLPFGALSVSWQLLPPATAVLKFLG